MTIKRLESELNSLRAKLTRDNAVESYHLVINLSSDIEFDEAVNENEFKRFLKMLKDSVLIRDGELFSQHFYTSSHAISSLIKVSRYY